jgi:hypothetical protein
VQLEYVTLTPHTNPISLHTSRKRKREERKWERVAMEKEKEGELILYLLKVY